MEEVIPDRFINEEKKRVLVSTLNEGEIENLRDYLYSITHVSTSALVQDPAEKVQFSEKNAKLLNN